MLGRLSFLLSLVVTKPLFRLVLETMSTIRSMHLLATFEIIFDEHIAMLYVSLASLQYPKVCLLLSFPAL